MSAPAEVNWERLDKTKFFVVGAGLFSGVTTALYPLTVIKTRQMAMEGAPLGLKGARDTAAALLKSDGIRGLYRGFWTVIFGTLPARLVYLTTLEVIKSSCQEVCQRFEVPEAEAAGICNFVAGATASLTTQSVVVPIDVVSQRLMIAGGRPAAAVSGVAGAAALAGTGHIHMGGLQMARHIIRAEGVMGLYRGLGASVATFVPSSALWWGSYGFYQKLVWQQVDKMREGQPCSNAHSSAEVLAVQTGSALTAGCTSAVLTNPLDVIKTRLQTADSASKPTWTSIARKLLQEEGFRGLFRGVAPRIASAAMWGTCMVSTYEFLKRICALPEPEGRPVI